jgi:hypothetical protein
MPTPATMSKVPKLDLIKTIMNLVLLPTVIVMDSAVGV